MLSLSSSAIERFLSLATQAAKEAGDFLLQFKQKDLNIIEDSLRDVKLEADRLSEKKILTPLMKNTDLPVLTEERGLIESKSGNTSGLMWIVDPLDGSVNYLQQIQYSCVSIALWENDTPILGVVYDFIHNELFAGIVEYGAWLNDNPIKVSSITEVKRAICFTGFPVSSDFSSDAISDVIKRVQNYKKIRILGSAALSLAYVAAGRGEAYYENNIKLWDVAAGIALVKSAGGMFSMIKSTVPNAVTLTASNKLTHCP